MKLGPKIAAQPVTHACIQVMQQRAGRNPMGRRIQLATNDALEGQWHTKQRLASATCSHIRAA
jgi:hypothetical protein